MATQTSTPGQRTDGMAVASLVMAVLSIIIGPLGFMPAIICGHVSRSRLRKDASLAGSGLATAGLIVGYVFLALFIAIAANVFLFWRSYYNSLVH